MHVLVNHLGYRAAGPKRVVIDAPAESLAGLCRVRRTDRTIVLERAIDEAGPVDRWRDRHFWTVDLSELSETGDLYLEIPFAASHEYARRAPRAALEGALRIADDPYRATLADIVRYFRSQRCSGRYDEADRRAPFFGGRPDRVDVHGGWFDAAGDLSKYLSHLSYANYLNPQQTPIVVWNLLGASDLLEAKRAPAALLEDMRREAAHGADFLVRMQDPAGYFYVTLFDRWSKDVRQREICTYSTQQGIKAADYQAGYRQGAGIAIAALARMSHSGTQGEFSADIYLDRAGTGFHHLEAHGLEYLDDRTENIIDDYCALLAAAELFAATHQDFYLHAARRRAENLIARLSEDNAFRGWWRADNHTRPYFHAVEAGLPVVALLRWAALEPGDDRRVQLVETVRASLDFELLITAEVCNPFGYARQYVRSLDGITRSSFFVPHDNESGYWWQGENARLASLAAAAWLFAPYATPDERRRLDAYAQDQINWILGANPFDSCMLFGRGRNNKNYEAEWPNVPGGICNGITAGYEDEHDIDFARDELGPTQRWRWTEQWLPHAAWYLLAIAAMPDERL